MDLLLGIAIPILGIAGLCTGNRAIFVVALVLIIVDNIIGFTSGQLKSLKTQIFAVIIGIIVAVIFGYDIFNAAVFALCVENASLLIAGIVVTVIGLFRSDAK